MTLSSILDKFLFGFFGGLELAFSDYEKEQIPLIFSEKIVRQ